METVSFTSLKVTFSCVLHTVPCSLHTRGGLVVSIELEFMLPLPYDFRRSALLFLTQVSPWPRFLDPILLTLLATKFCIDSFKEIIYILSN